MQPAATKPAAIDGGNGYKITYNSLYCMWEISHKKIGGGCLAEFKQIRDAINYCKAGK